MSIKTIANCMSALKTLTEKNKPFVLKDFYTCTEPTGALRNREWDLGERPTALLDTAAGRAIRLQGIPTGETTVDADWVTLDANDTNSSATVQDLQLIEGFLKVDEQIQLRWATGSAGYLAVLIGLHCAPLELMIEASRGSGTLNPTNSLNLPRGIHAIQMWNIDDWVNISPAAQVSTDDENFAATNVPSQLQLSRTKPVETAKCLKLCADGAVVDPLTNKPVNVAAEGCYLDAYGACPC